jgi:putative DNA primase/helicase
VPERRATSAAVGTADVPSVAAAAYAAQGWPVFPLHGFAAGLCTCTRPACSSPGKHPRTRQGLKDASTNEPIVAGWWERWPDANVGVRTGSASGLLVLDVDADSNGEQSLAGLEQIHGSLPDTVTALTGGGGKHLFFRHPGGEVRNSAGKLGEGLDIRADGGYIVAPPSIHVSGRAYRWQEGHASGEVPLADPPGWLLALLSRRDPTGQVPAAVLPIGVIAEGSRNATLASLAGGMRRRGMSEQELLAELQLINSDRVEPPLPDSELAAIAASISRYPAGPAPHQRYKRTDYGNAERLVDRHGHRLRFCAGLGWLVWDGRRWQRDHDRGAMRLMKETVRAMWFELAEIADPDAKSPFCSFLLRSESEPRLKAALKLAESEASVVVSASELDREPWLLNVTNGTLDLRTGELRAHDPADLLTKLSPVTFEGDARSPLWESFLERITGGDDDLRCFLQRAVGYSLTGDTREEKLFFAHGPAASGKSTFLEAIKAVLGDYATTADFESFLKKKSDAGVRNDIARLAGTRMTIGIEVDEGKRLAEGLLKTLTGGDTITARHLYKEFFEFLPQFKLWLAANARPRVSASDSGMWRRIVQVPFAEAIPEEERDPRIKLQLKGDPQVQSAVLAWALEGCRAWQEQGLLVPERVRRYTEEYRAENDPLADFFDERCVFEPRAVVRRSELRRAYEEWARENGEWPVAPRTLAGALKARGGNDGAKRGGERAWRGVRLRLSERVESLSDSDSPF